jgi:hypothetical protein
MWNIDNPDDPVQVPENSVGESFCPEWLDLRIDNETEPEEICFLGLKTKLSLVDNGDFSS